jgi:fermentation-respiration switch protein FrsA (DUF1100 family)
MRRLVRLSLLALVAYAGVCALARWKYRFLLYPGTARPRTPLDLEWVAELPVRAEDGVRTFGLLVEGTRSDGSPAPVVVVWHGNGEQAADLLPYAAILRERGLAVFLPEYRGYPGTEGTPGEAGILADADAALAALAVHTGPRAVVLHGVSLGTGVAIRAASRPPPDGLRWVGLVLQSPYTSIVEAGARAFWFLPVRWLLPDRFDALALAPQVGIPTTVFHGDQDDVVPFDMGRAIAAAIPGAELRIVEGAGHNDLQTRDRGSVVRSLVEMAGD